MKNPLPLRPRIKVWLETDGRYAFGFVKPMAIPVLGGLLIADEVVDIFLPVRFYWVRRARWLKLHQEAASQELQVEGQ